MYICQGPSAALYFVSPAHDPQLNILDDEQSRFSIYRTEIGHFALGEALSDEKLVELCRAHGDSIGSLKLLVSHSSAKVHEPQTNNSLSPSANTVPPPVLPNYGTAASCAPLRPRRRSRSRHGSLSSSEQLTTEVSAGYEADLDSAEREPHRPTAVRPLPQIGSLASSIPHSPGRRPNGPARATSPKPSRSNTPSPPASSDRTREPVVQDRFGNIVPAPPPPPPLSPLRSNFAINDDDVLMPPPRRHTRADSDAAAERQRALEASEHQMPSTAQRLRNPGHLENRPSRDTLRDRRTRPTLPQQRLDADDSMGRPDSWVYASRHNDASPSTSQDPESSPSTQPRQSPAKPRIARHQQQLSPRYKSSAPYSNRTLNIPAPPRNPPPNVPLMSPESRAGPSRVAGQPVPANFVVTWKGEQKGDQKLTPTSASAPWTRSIKGAKSMDSLRASSIPSTLQPGRRANGGQLPITRSNNNLGYAPKPTGATPRPLPSKNGSSSSQYASRTSSSGYNGGYMSPNGTDPFPRPHSALGDAASPSSSYQRPHPDSVYPSDFAGYGRSPPTLSPTLPLVPSRQNSRPSDNMTGISSVISPPQSPTSPQSPRSLPRMMDGRVRQSFGESSSETLNAEDRGWLLKAVMDSAEGGESTVVPPHRVEQKPPLPPPSYPPLSSYGNYDYDSDRESEEGGTMWQKPPVERPILTVHIEGTNGQSVPLSSSTSSGSQSTQQPPARRGRGRGSTFTDAREASWAPRPPPEDVYERLEEFFPEHDLDKPVIEANSGGTSPTVGEILPPPAPPPSATDTILPVPPIPGVAERSRMRGKKSIRIVAEEHKRRINRVSRQDPAVNSTVLRKRSTKLWGSKVEEVTPGQARATLGANPDSPSGGPSE